MNLITLENNEIAVHHHVPLAQYTTFQLGGPCSVLLSCETPAQLKQAVQFCVTEQKNYIVIGGGSNLVVSDQGIDCYVIRYESKTPLIERLDNRLIVSGSTLLDDLARYAAENGLEGLNCATGIPGTVGGAVVGNAGAFGRQIGDVVERVDVIERAGTVKSLDAKMCGFSYRHSALKETGNIVGSARISLSSGDPSLLRKEREEILAVRRAKHPDLSLAPCAGSFFRNVEPTSKAGKRQAAGWFLDKAGGKALKAGGARIFDKHANIIIKTEQCTAQDVFELSQQMARLAKEKFQLDLVREVRFVGMFQGMPEGVKTVIW